MEHVHFITTYFSFFTQHYGMCCVILLHWNELTHAVCGNWKYWGVHCVSMWQKCKHSTQFWGKSCSLHHDLSWLTKLCSSPLKKETWLHSLDAQPWPLSPSYFPQAKSYLFISAVACNCGSIHLLLFWGVWMWHVYIKCLFSTKTECLYCPKFEHVSVEKNISKRLIIVQKWVSVVVQYKGMWTV